MLLADKTCSKTCSISLDILSIFLSLFVAVLVDNFQRTLAATEERAKSHKRGVQRSVFQVRTKTRNPVSSILSAELRSG